ncbi:MAG: undecaprenyl/decaprenyl-phosphate alpha-N-acetylglucosaminyl 1-phosphate transferase [Candidatus Eremiobacteraeota bacterium]|nr:undecaprenyl/decaprenyl-phosphate alpha-N-acetylglucosaminyl 1-phosphate transferase [Candidatus Eremiobacteraeota bacterium]
MKTNEGLILLYATAVVLAGAVTALATPLVRRLASHVGVLDQTGERRMHAEPKPRIGGIGVFFGFAFALFAVLGFALLHPALLYPAFASKIASIRIDAIHDQLDASHNLVGLLFGSMLILGVGVWDDIMGMRARNKFFAQILVALVSMLYGFIIPGVANPFDHDPATYWIAFPIWVSIPLTLFWYVAMMNAINFIDGLDGLLSGVAVISCLSIFVISVTHGDPVVALVVASLAGAALGFLPYNFNPAKIILGDGGSLFIGYVFATVSMIGASKSAIAIGLLVPLVVLALPILDTFFAIARRALSGKSITEADRGHFHHQLIFRFGMNVRQAVLLIYAVCIALGFAALVVSGTIHIKL